MSKFTQADERRRAFLLRALASGAFAAAGLGASQNAHSMGKLSRELPPGKSIYKVSGSVFIDGVKATTDTPISSNSVIKTGAGAELIFAVGKDAFLMRGDSQLVLKGKSFLVESLNLISGRLLSVFGKTEHVAVTTVATIGIRGTGLYLQADKEKTYACTCYGETVLIANDDPGSRETIATSYHDAPRYIYASGESGQRIKAAPVIDHKDSELVLIEELVGRLPPFGKKYNRY